MNAPGTRTYAVIGCVAGLTGVMLAAMGSHLGGGIDNFESWRSWHSANMMHLVHALALLQIAAWLRSNDSGFLQLAAFLMTAGMLLFCVSVYYSVLAESGTAGIAPLGGLCLMAGWLALLMAFVRTRPQTR